MARKAAAKKQAKTLDELLEGVQRKYGKKALAVASEVEELYTVKHLPTGVGVLDEVLGGGLPRGHITEFFGPPSAGKSYVALLAVAETLRSGGTAAWIDSEVSFPVALAHHVGIDMDKLMLGTPENGEEALDEIIELIKHNIDLVVLDSATSLASKDTLDSEVELAGFAPGVRLWNAGLTRIKPLLAFRPTAFVFVNQVRDNVGVMYGPQTTEPLGWKSKHDSVLRLEVRRKEWLKTNEKRVGQISMIRVAKSKMDGCIPFAEVTLDIPFAEFVKAP